MVREKITNFTLIQMEMCKSESFLCRHSIEKTKNATSVILHPFWQAIWWDIWKHTGNKSKECMQCDGLIIHLIRQAIWGKNWKCTCRQIVTSVTMNSHRQTAKQVQPVRLCLLSGVRPALLRKRLNHTVEKTSQELRMLSSVTLNCQVTMIVLRSGSQLSEM